MKSVQWSFVISTILLVLGAGALSFWAFQFMQSEFHRPLFVMAITLYGFVVLMGGIVTGTLLWELTEE